MNEPKASETQVTAANAPLVRGLRLLQRLRWTVLWFLLIWLLSKPVVLLGISGYQRFVSPHKGWRCAYAVLNGCLSCSAYGKAVIAEYGVVGGCVLLWGRFGDCRNAAMKIAARSSGGGDCGKQCGDDCARGCLGGSKGASRSNAPKPQRPLPNVALSTPSLRPILAFPLPGSFDERKARRARDRLYCFGSVRLRDGKRHVGVDWPAKPGEAVYAVEKGIVSGVANVASGKPWGKVIIIEHSGFTTGYAHVRPLPTIVRGKEVTSGMQIGVVEDIDRDPAYPEEQVPDHLHFEIRIGDKSNVGIGYLPPALFPAGFKDPENGVQYLSVLPPGQLPVRPLPGAR